MIQIYDFIYGVQGSWVYGGSIFLSVTQCNAEQFWTQVQMQLVCCTVANSIKCECESRSNFQSPIL